MWWFITALVITSFFLPPAYAYDNNLYRTYVLLLSTLKLQVLMLVDIQRPQFGFATKFVDVNNMPGLNTLGISVVRVDLEPQGLVPLHPHPRASALTTIMEGTLYV
ncbi:hypothetical protein HAX54_003246 [Datura stramonium]|uniref:Cupin type-1 domain-containing protein n=1 Tax=Datura stramonium TaxID=4076 RepID=A0ABS8T629_DATST|nr:hypothetical protein [Datura stramonium]